MSGVDLRQLQITCIVSKGGIFFSSSFTPQLCAARQTLSHGENKTKSIALLTALLSLLCCRYALQLHRCAMHSYHGHTLRGCQERQTQRRVHCRCCACDRCRVDGCVRWVVVRQKTSLVEQGARAWSGVHRALAGRCEGVTTPTLSSFVVLLSLLSSLFLFCL
jgi:hypothetical protein